MIKQLGTFLLVMVLSIPPARASEAWKVMTWDECLAESKKNHPDLISAEEVVKGQKAGKGIAVSGLLPQINASAGISRTRTGGASGSSSNFSSGSSSVSGGSSRKTVDQYSYGINGTQLLFDGFKTANGVSAASQNVNAAKENFKFVSSTIRFNLRSAFVNLLSAQELIKVSREIVKIRKDDYDLITLRYQSGLEHKGALLTSESNLVAANVELSKAERALTLAQRQLTKEMGREEFTPMYVRGDFLVRDTSREQPDLERLAKNNPSLLQAIAKKNSALFTLKSTYGAFSPVLSGSAGADKTDTRWPPKKDAWDMGLTLSMPIFEGGLRLAQVQQAEAAYKQAEADERSARDGIIVKMEQAWVKLQDAVETVSVQAKSLEAAEMRSKIAEAQYSTGFITFDNWIIIENDLVTAKKAFLAAQADALLTEAGWIQSKGETLEYAE
ncbi:MAG: TolC family protein [Candidatus Omnitrophica bacterium]|nr:TolC family protein [Candidatus Omnitrophota bacterium]